MQILVILFQQILQNSNMGKERSTNCLLLSHLQRELWSLGGPVHRLSVAGGQSCRAGLLREAIRRHEIAKALWETEVHSQSIIQPTNKSRD